MENTSPEPQDIRLREPTRSVRVIVRHSANCKDRDKGNDYRRCDCRKSLLIYDGETRKKITANGQTRLKLSCRVQSAKTRSWDKAENQAQELRDSWDPEKRELKRLRAEKKAQEVSIEEAVALYCADLIARLGQTGTVANIRSLFGHIDPETKAVQSKGHLFEWLDKQNPRPTFIADLNPTHLTTWRSSWKFGDLTAANRWSVVKAFFGFCESQGWIDDSPARKLKPLNFKRGNRTAVFTDDQYRAILKAVSVYDPENVPAMTRKSWQRRLRAFVELLRFSGMDLIDAVQFRPGLVDVDGVLRYRRQKTDVLGTLQLPPHVVRLLQNLPLEKDSVGKDQPFRQKHVKPQSDTATWARRLEALFKLAEIKEVQTGIGQTKRPHAKMFRDTFAVNKLRHGASVYAVSKMLGHSKVTTTEKAYLPWIKELETMTIREARDALKKELPTATSRGKKTS